MSEHTPEVIEGWYPDPFGANSLRYWDGDNWTDSEHPLGVPDAVPTSASGRTPAARSQKQQRSGAAILGTIAAVTVLIAGGVAVAHSSSNTGTNVTSRPGGGLTYVVPAGGFPGDSNVPSAPHGIVFQPTLLRHDVIAKSKVLAYISVANVGDTAGAWVCTVVIRNANGTELGSRRFASKAPLAGQNSERMVGQVTVNAGTASQADEAASSITCK